MWDIYWSLVIPLVIIMVFNISLFVLIKVKVIQRLKLTKNLIVVLLVVTLVPIFCTGFVAQRKISSVIFTDVYNSLMAVGKTRMIFVNDHLEEVKLDAETIAKNWIVMESLRQISIEKVSKIDPNFNTLYKNMHGHLTRIASTKGYDDIMLVSAEGKIELTTGAKHAKELGFDVSSEIYFKEGKAKTYFTNLFYNKITDTNLMYVVTPCLGVQGQFLGCLIIEMDMKKIYSILSDREGLGNTGETYIVNQEKLMISESRFLKDTVLKVKVDTMGANDGLAGKSGIAIYPDYRGIPVVGAWYPIKHTNWVLLAEIDEAEAFAPLRINRINQIILVSVTVIMVVIIAIFSSRAMVKPVHELTEVSLHIGEGKLDRDVKIHSNDEIGILINVFNEMIKNMRLLARQATVISKGDLTISVDAKGELANAFNYMLESLRALIKQTQDSIGRISSVSMEIFASSEEQSSGAAELAASVGEITATIEELSSSAKQIAANAESVEKVAEDSEATYHHGMEAVSASIHIMEDIKGVTKDSAGKILSLSEKAQKIGDVLGIIKEIAGETHLLALNASIEASAAGEFGKRFGVVAAEVRRLAERTKMSAEEIKGVVSEIQMATNAAVLSTEQSVKNVEKGVEIAQKAGQSIESIMNLTKETTDASRQIVMATQQQKSATEQVAVTMKEISEVVRQTAVGLKQTTAAVAELNKLADDLKDVVKKFKT
ncbi:MAG: methyl-accepting chemotaxis protein [Planctomycetes bacterium]|nr:methyl-accepting chemotaxis protein [Planctomycetota bacterium]